MTRQQGFLLLFLGLLLAAVGSWRSDATDQGKAGGASVTTLAPADEERQIFVWVMHYFLMELAHERMSLQVAATSFLTFCRTHCPQYVHNLKYVEEAAGDEARVAGNLVRCLEEEEGGNGVPVTREQLAKLRQQLAELRSMP